MSSVGRRWLTALLAIAGVVMAHTAGFALVHPDPAARARHLLASGHGYWPVALATAAAIGLLAAAVAVVVGAARGASAAPSSPGGGSVGRLLLRLVGLQLALFTAVETLEHLARGAAPADLVGAPEFLLGLPLQVLAAVAVVAVLGVLELVAERVTSRMRAVRPRFPREGNRARSDRGTPGPAPVWVVRPRGPPPVALF